MTAAIRAMTLADVDGVVEVVRAADVDADRRAGRAPGSPTPQQARRFREGMERFVTRDPGGAVVAEQGGVVVGMAEAIRRGDLWGLSMLFVHPDSQNQGLGRRLLDATLEYAQGARLRMIMASPDPRAMRRYSMAGLAIHPAVEATGTIERTAVPADLTGRAGDAGDLGLVDDVDAGLAGRRAEDVEFMLANGCRLEIVDAAAGRGFAVHRENRVLMLGATDEATAATVFWRALAETDGDASVYCLTAGQDWAVRVALAARMKVVAGGALFVSGRDQPPGPWIPSGWYF